VTVVGVVVVMGVLAVVLMRTRAMRASGFLFAALWGFLLASTAAGPPLTGILNQLGAALWQAVTSL
jgi:hypothetical protein